MLRAGLGWVISTWWAGHSISSDAQFCISQGRYPPWALSFPDMLISSLVTCQAYVKEISRVAKHSLYRMPSSLLHHSIRIIGCFGASAISSRSAFVLDHIQRSYGNVNSPLHGTHLCYATCLSIVWRTHARLLLTGNELYMWRTHVLACGGHMLHASALCGGHMQVFF